MPFFLNLIADTLFRCRCSTHWPLYIESKHNRKEVRRTISKQEVCHEAQCKWCIKTVNRVKFPQNT